MLTSPSARPQPQENEGRARRLRRIPKFLAVHESGHAVVAEALGIEVELVWAGDEHQFEPALTDDGIRAKGGTFFLHPESVGPRELAVIAISGPIAQSKVEKKGYFTALARGGHRDIRAAMDALDGDACDYSSCEKRARRLVNKHWERILALAEALQRDRYRRGRLS